MEKHLNELEALQDCHDLAVNAMLGCNSTTEPLELVCEQACREARRLGIECEEPKDLTHEEAMNFVGKLMAQVEAKKREELKTLSHLSVEQAASLLQVSKDVIYDLCKSGELQHQKVGRVIRIKRTDLDRVSVEDDW